MLIPWDVEEEQEQLIAPEGKPRWEYVEVDDVVV
jgi:hypothetical protein